MKTPDFHKANEIIKQYIIPPCETECFTCCFVENCPNKFKSRKCNPKEIAK